MTRNFYPFTNLWIFITNELRTKFSYKILNKRNITTYFENLMVKLHVLYVLNTHVKFCVNRILFTIWFINLYFIDNFILQKFAI